MEQVLSVLCCGLIICEGFKPSSPLLIYGTHSKPDKLQVSIAQGSNSNLESILYVANNLKSQLTSLCFLYVYSSRIRCFCEINRSKEKC